MVPRRPGVAVADPATGPASLQQSLAAIVDRNSGVAPSQIHEWLTSPTRDISTRLAIFSTFPDGSIGFGAVAARPGSSSSSIPTSSYHHSTTSTTHNHRPHSSRKDSCSSMARTCLHQPSNASTYPPSLLYSEATPTESSISTGLASRFSGVPLLEEVDGVLERRPNQIRQPVFECSFWFLSCSYISHDQAEWATHCLSHFRGEEPPRSVQCPLCEDFQYTGDNGWISWKLRMEHVADHHLMGHTLRTSRPDFHLFQHLWQKRLIDDQDLKELKGGNHNLTRPPANFIETNGRRGHGREPRGQRRQHVGLRTRPA